MKVVINKCFGGFGLSPSAVKRLAELNGRECYFFRNSYKHLGETADYNQLVPMTLKEAEDFGSFVNAYDLKDWHKLSHEEQNKLYDAHSLYYNQEERTNPKLIQVIEELGARANGLHAKLQIVDVPDGVEYEIDEYDGQEHIAEKHRTWS